jgi:hypothetical protein
MGFNWQALTHLLLQLSKVAIEWYRMIAGDADGERSALKVASIVLDPDRPEGSAEEVVLE